MTKDRSYNLDFIKVIATCLIVLHHFQQVENTYYEGSINYFGGKFYFGYIVELFFVLSGYFMYCYINKIDSMSFYEFIVKRAKRLLPLMTISVVVCVMFFEMIKRMNVEGSIWNTVTPTLWGMIINSLGIQVGWGFQNPCLNNPTWYVSVLMLCYAVFFAVTKYCKKNNISVFQGYMFIVLLGCGIYEYGIEMPFLNRQVARGYYAFFAGVLLAKVIEKLVKNKVMVFLCLVISVIVPYAIYHSSIFITYRLEFVLTFIFYPSIIVCFSTNIVRNIFKHKIWGYLGKISYDIFIWHVPVLMAMDMIVYKLRVDINFDDIKIMYVFLALTIIVGIISYFTIEKPLDKYIEKLLNKGISYNMEETV